MDTMIQSEGQPQYPGIPTFEAMVALQYFKRADWGVTKSFVASDLAQFLGRSGEERVLLKYIDVLEHLHMIERGKNHEYYLTNSGLNHLHTLLKKNGSALKALLNEI